ncbi:hypothetical protein M426DRAFT_57748 [Hypoxylon sp. CI-4A]|nr:hypothetical protein M426DRAFT_57748 [Hypoxylon sp. CI-4A]
MDGIDDFDGDEDAALRYAIALSLQEAGGRSPEKPIELSSDEEDGDVEKPEKGSGVERSENPTAKQAPKTIPLEDVRAIPHQSLSAATTAFTSLGLDRKKMEEERLARLGKRKASDLDSGIETRRQKPKLDTQSPTLATEDAPRHLPYPKGIVKKTWAAGFLREQDIKIEEVLQKNELELAVISSFQWDEEWMLSKIDLAKTKMVCVAFASSEEQQKEIRANIPTWAAKNKRIKFCFPPMMSTGNMHSKLQLLKYPNYLRIVVPSGNFVPYDWGESGVIENMVFLIDLPRIDDPSLRSSNQLGPFGEELTYFLQAQGLEDSLVKSLSNYDFSEANRYRFVHSIAGSHLGDKWQRTAIKSLGLTGLENIEIDMAISSLGSLNMDLVLAIYYAAQDDGTKEYGMRTSKGAKASKAKSPAPDLTGKFRIYFPSHDTVVKSRGGKNAAGTICVQSKWWDSPTFPRQLFRDCKSVRSGLLIHSKLILVRHSQSEESKAAYGYVGSANLSESAWGRLVKERGTGNLKLTCRNWECGVIEPLSDPLSTHTNSSRKD